MTLDPDNLVNGVPDPERGHPDKHGSATADALSAARLGGMEVDARHDEQGRQMLNAPGAWTVAPRREASCNFWR